MARRNRGQRLLPASIDYDDMTGRPYRRSRLEDIWDQFETPIRWGAFLLPLILSLIALGVALDTRGRLPDVTPQILATATSVVTDTPTPLPPPTATPPVSIIPLPSSPAGLCQGSVKTSPVAEYLDAPSSNAAVLGVFAPFQRLNIMSKNGSFIFVEVGSIKGWILDIQVQFDNPACAISLPTTTESP